MVAGDSAALLPSLRNVVVFVLVVMLVVIVVVMVMMMVKMMIATVQKMMMVMHCGVEGKKRVRCMKMREENGRKMRK
jgi:hypothetical protein